MKEPDSEVLEIRRGSRGGWVSERVRFKSKGKPRYDYWDDVEAGR